MGVGQVVKANDVNICYEEFGSADDPALLLVAGFSAQLTMWPVEFCNLLAQDGFRVIRFDNRDAGLSSKTEGPLPALAPVIGAAAPGAAFRLEGEAPYTLADMAADAVGLLDVLRIDRSHIVGASLGGMIVQRLAINSPERVLSLTTIMSSTGDPSVGQSSPEALAALFTPVAPEREAVLEHAVVTGRVVGGPLFDEADTRRVAGEFFDRMYYPQGGAFQYAAFLADGDRTEGLGSVRLPTLVIHGRADTLIHFSGGEATAKAVPGAAFLAFDEMGHNLPPKLWSQIAKAISEHGHEASP